MRFGFSRLLVFALALGAALTPSRPARACWCSDPPGSDAGAMNVSDVAFLGIVRGVRTTGGVETTSFEVLTPYKATRKGARIDVSGPGSCGQHFQAGQRWSVFARRRGGRLETSVCDGTHPE